MINKKAKIISVVGAGGKTTLVFNIANEYARKGNSVLITTATHMLDDGFYHSLDEALKKCSVNGNPKKSHIYKIGSSRGDRVGILSKEELDRAKEIFDYIIVEADGSRCMPIKKPDLNREPMILDESSKIYIVMGKAAIGRKFKIVCHRYNLLTNEEKNEIEKLFCKNNESIDDLLVTEELLKYCSKKFYIEYLATKFPEAEFITYLADMRSSKNYKQYKKIAFVNLASGKSSRFTKSIKDMTSSIVKDRSVSINGKTFTSDKLIIAAEEINNKLNEKTYVNKLLINYKGRPVYEYLLKSQINAKKNIIDYFKSECKHSMRIDIGIVTPYSKLASMAKKFFKNIDIINNNLNNEGIASSIKKAVSYYKDYDAVVFFNADYINLSALEISKFVINSILSNTLSSMMCNEESDAVVPAFADKKLFKDIKKLSGDKGAKNILSKELCYLYHIDDESLKDIDDIKDILL